MLFLFASATGSIMCSDCPAGSFQYDYGQSSCLTCWQYWAYRADTTMYESGYYQPDAGQPVCLQCAKGLAANKAQTSCVAPWSCPAGQYVNLSYTCDTCQSGSYSDGTCRVLKTCAQACTPCPAGTSNPNPTHLPARNAT